MQVFLSDYREVITPSMGRCVRFSVTLVSGDGEPLMTQKGFLVNRERHVMAPRVPTKYGRWVSWVDLSEEFVTWLQEALEKVPEVRQILGPKVEVKT